MYTLTKIKTFIGREGYGLNADIERDGRKVAFVLDDASGGEVRVDFFVGMRSDGAEQRKAAHEFALAWYKTAEEAARIYGDKVTGAEALVCWINEAADLHATKKKFDRAAKSQTLFRLKGDKKDNWRTIKHSYVPKIQEFLDKKYGDQIERIYNRDGL